MNFDINLTTVNALHPNDGPDKHFCNVRASLTDTCLFNLVVTAVTLYDLTNGLLQPHERERESFSNLDSNNRYLYW